MCCTCPPQELETEWERQQVQEQLQRNQLERLHDDLRRVNWKLGKEERDTGQCYWIAHVNKTSMVMPLWDDMNSCCKSTERGHFEAITGNQLLGNKLAHNICSILRSCSSRSYTSSTYHHPQTLTLSHTHTHPTTLPHMHIHPPTYTCTHTHAYTYTPFLMRQWGRSTSNCW